MHGFYLRIVQIFLLIILKLPTPQMVFIHWQFNISANKIIIYRGVGSINNYNSLWLLVYKKLRIIQSYRNPFSKLRQIHTDCGTRLSTKKRWTYAQTSPRLWNLYLALSKGLTAKKIELYGVFYFPATLLLQNISGVWDIFIIVYVVKGKG